MYPILLKKYRQQYRFAAVFERLLNFRPRRYCDIDFMPHYGHVLWSYVTLCGDLWRL